MTNELVRNSDKITVKEFEKYEITILFEGKVRSIVIENSSFIIGRSPKVSVPIPFDLISREHLKISLVGEDVFLEELGASNGTWLNGTKLKSKKVYTYENEGRIILGNIKGPVVLIQCFFKESEIESVAEDMRDEEEYEDEYEEEEEYEEREDKELVKDEEFEEITLVKEIAITKNEDDKEVENNIINMRKNSHQEQESTDLPQAKVANGSYEIYEAPVAKRTVSSEIPVRSLQQSHEKSLIEPDLLMQMKNLLNLEAQKVERESQKEANALRVASLEEAASIKARAQKEAESIHLKTLEESKNQLLKTNAECEKIKAQNIKKVEFLLNEAKTQADKLIAKSIKEATELLAKNTKEASDVRIAAIKESDELVENASKKAKETRQLAKKESIELVLEATKEADEIRHSANQEKDNLLLNITSEIEQLRFITKKETDELLSKVTEEVAELRLNAKTETDDLFQSTIKEVDDMRSSASLEAESLVQKAIKESSELRTSSKKESVELMLLATDEVANIRLHAQTFSEELISKSRENAAKLLKETEYIAQLKLDESKRLEEEKSKSIKQLNEMYQDLKGKIDHLKNLESEAQKNYDSLTKGFEKEQARITIERSSLEVLRADLTSAKNECEKQLAELKSEERSVKAQCESAIIEQKSIVAKIMDEVGKSQLLKDNLKEEILAINCEKERVESLVKEADLELRQKRLSLDQMAEEERAALNDLNKIKQTQSEILAGIENEKQDLLASQEKLLKDEAESLDKIRKINDEIALSSEKMTQDLKNFDLQKAELERAFQKEKIGLQQKLDDEMQKVRSLHDIEIQELIGQKKKLSQEIEKSEIESIHALEQMIKKNKEEAQLIQRLVKEETDKQKNEAKNQLALLKTKFTNIVAQLNRDHLETKKAMNAELLRMATMKKNTEQELKFLETTRQEKIARIDSEIKELQAEAKLKMENISKKSDLEIREVKASIADFREKELKTLSDLKEREMKSLEEYKQSEMESITEMKENAVREIHGKKAERAKLITTNVDGLILTHLNKFRNKKINDEFIESCSSELNILVYDSLMNRSEADKAKLEMAIKTKNNVREKSQSMQKLMYWGLAIIVIAGIFVLMPQLLTMPEFHGLKVFLDENNLNVF
jgi:pSer/pThr/pTyr-binding forkhead associated (FHA) protein